MTEDKKLDLPAYPDGILDWTEEQEKHLKFSGDMENIHKRTSFKLWNTWLSWIDLRNNEKLIDIISKKCDDKESDEFYLKQLLVSHIDRLGKILGQTNITEEIIKLEKNII